MRRYLLILLALIASLFVASGAQAVVLNDQGTYAGVALVPGTKTLPTTVTPITSTAACTDPWLSADLGGPSRSPVGGLVFHAGGAVMHGNETFAITWDPTRTYWTGTRDYVEQFLRDVADSSSTLASPYAITAQYNASAG